MKQKDIEILLSNLKTFEKPKIQLEQYQIPSRLAAMITWRALQLGDLKEKVVADYCCGTGMFSIAAQALGAKRTYGIDIDLDALNIAKANAKKAGENIIWVQEDIREVNMRFNTIFMNSPFGIQSDTKDREFLSAALEHSDVCYSVHLSLPQNIKFLTKIIEKQEKKLTETIEAEFEIPKTYYFHKKRYHIIVVAILRSA